MKNLSDFPPKLSPKMKMADAINQYHSLLTVLPRLNIPLGFGEKSIEQLCSEHHVSLPLFTLISRVYCQEDYYPTANELQQCPMADILQYLVSSHKDYLENKLPHIEHHLNILLEPMDRKYSTLKHPNISLSADGNAPPYRHGRVKYATASITVASETDPEAGARAVVARSGAASFYTVRSGEELLEQGGSNE